MKSQKLFLSFINLVVFMFTQVMSALSLHATQIIFKSNQLISSSQQVISSALRSAMQSLSYCTSYASKVISRVCTISVVKIFVTCAISFRSYVPALHMSDPSPALEQILTSRLPKGVVLLIRPIIASQKLNDIFTLIVHWLQERPRLIKALAIVGIRMPPSIAFEVKALKEANYHAFYVFGAILALHLVKVAIQYGIKCYKARVFAQNLPQVEEIDNPPAAQIHSRRASADKSVSSGYNALIQLKSCEPVCSDDLFVQFDNHPLECQNLENRITQDSCQLVQPLRKVQLNFTEIESLSSKRLQLNSNLTTTLPKRLRQFQLLSLKRGYVLHKTPRLS